MFGITTFIFVLGIIALVLWITAQFQATLLVTESAVDLSLFFSYRTIIRSQAPITRLMVRLHHAFISYAWLN